jgi:hypothetical protein
MSFAEIGLGKLLKAFYADPATRRRMLLDDIRKEIRKASAVRVGTGGDFYGPFWADAKAHVSGRLNLRLATAGRILENDGRSRLYTMLEAGFLLWWEEKRRQRNEQFTIIESTVKARINLPNLGTIKIENTLCFTVGLDAHRIVYPYFSDEVVLPEEGARIGLWIMSKGIDQFSLRDMRILDLIQARSFSVADTPLTGNEESIFASKYAETLTEWNTLRVRIP